LSYGRKCVFFRKYSILRGVLESGVG